MFILVRRRIYKMNNDKRQKTEVYTRVVGYLRPVNQFNEGKTAEFKDRKEFKKF